MTTATLFSIQRFSTEDGPGIRTTLFFKGCPLICPWCHNPEGMRKQPELVWYDIDCVGCGDCVNACPNGALKLTEEGIVIDRGACEACGTCVDACDVGALEIIGEEWTPDALLDEVLKDRTFYETSGGGVTASGGEPLMYYEFLREFLPKLKDAGVHVALDTCGHFPTDKFVEILKFVDLLLFDIKTLDEAKHKEFTGVGLGRVLANAQAASERGVPMWIRTPVIPGYTDSDGNIRSIARFIRERLPAVERWDLLAFSNLCTSKYRRLGGRFALEGEPLLSRERMDELERLAKSCGVGCAVWSGPTSV